MDNKSSKKCAYKWCENTLPVGSTLKMCDNCRAKNRTYKKKQPAEEKAKNTITTSAGKKCAREEGPQAEDRASQRQRAEPDQVLKGTGIEEDSDDGDEGFLEWKKMVWLLK
jgi:hypothetical protein